MYLRVVFDTFAVRFTFISSINVYLAVCDVFYILKVFLKHLFIALTNIIICKVTKQLKISRFWVK